MSTEHDVNTSPLFGDIPDPADGATPRASVRPPTLDAEDRPRSSVRRLRWLALVFSAFWYAAHLLAYGIRSDLHSLPWLYQMAQISLPLSLALASLWLALSPGRLGLGVKVEWLSVMAIVGPLSFWMIALWAPEPRIPDPATLLSTFLCFDITLAWAGIPLLLAVVGLRRAFPSASAWRSALLGSACGLFAAGIMNLHCANVNRWHLVAAHGLPILIAIAVGAWLVKKAVRI